MDPMTYLTLKNKLSKHRVVGMGGLLDTSRFNYYLSRALDVAHCSDIEGIVVAATEIKLMIPPNQNGHL